MTDFIVLILGDGNFSFTLALVRALFDDFDHANPHSIARLYLRIPDSVATSNIRILATSFDSRPQLLRKYAEFKDIERTLLSSRYRGNVALTHTVNAWELHSTFPLHSSSHKEEEEEEEESNRIDAAWARGLRADGSVGFDAVAWNHPHLGTEDFRLHRFLMAHFFDSVASVLNPRNPSSSVIVSLVSGQETRWDLVAQALRSNLHLSTDDSPFPFQESDWKGYVVKRNMHGKSFKNEATKKRMVDDMKSFGFRFVRSDPQAQAAAHESALAALAATGLGKLSLVQDKKKQKEQERQLSTACPDAVTSADPISTDYTVRTRTSVISTHLAGTPTDTSITTATTTSSTLPKTKALLNSLPLPSPLACPFCAKPFSTPRAYKQHVLQIHILQQRGPDWTPDAPRTLPCRGWPRSNTPACSKRFAHADARWQHEVIKHSRLDAGEDAPILQAAVPDAAAPGVEPFLAITDEPTEDAEYVPCDVCGQAVARRAWGMALHLETLKPVVGLDMRCPRDCGVRGFIERRALWQHYMFCRLKGLPDGAGEEEEEEEVVVVEKEEGN